MKPILKVDRKRFVEWMYNTKEDMIGLANDVIDSISSDGKYIKDILDVWGSCGYIHKSMVLNPEVAIWNEDDEIEDPYQDYDVEWVK